MRYTLPVESGNVGVRELMRLGDEVEVVGPPALRERMAAMLAAMAHRYFRRRAQQIAFAGLPPGRLAAKRSP